MLNYSIYCSRRRRDHCMCLDYEYCLDHPSRQGVLNISDRNLNSVLPHMSVCWQFVQTSQSNNTVISQLFNPATNLHLMKINIILTRQILLICDFNLDLNQRDIFPYFCFVSAATDINRRFLP